MAYIPGMANKNTKPDRVPGGDKVMAADADKTARLQRALTGRDVINALAGSPLTEVTIERLSVKSKVRDVDL
ncbi:hypothetical protein [Bradyrhizobium sp.]